MKRPSRILAGTAIGLLMTSAPLLAQPLPGDSPERNNAPLIVAQADCEGEDCPPREERAPAEEQKAPEEAASPEDRAPEPEVAPEAEPGFSPQPEQAPAEEAPEPEPVPQSEPEVQPEAEPTPQPEPDQAREAEPAPEAEPQQAPAAEEPAPQPEEAPQTEAEPQPQAEPAEEPAATEQKPAGQEPVEQSPREKPQAEQPADRQPAQEEPRGEQQPASGEQPAPSDGTAPDAQSADQDEAPLFDSQKEADPARSDASRERGSDRERARERDGDRNRDRNGARDTEARPAPEAVDPGPPPESDAAATRDAQPRSIEKVTQEPGTRRDRAPDEERRYRERDDGFDVLREIGDRVIMQLGNQVMVESSDRPRMTRNASDVYYEDLPRGRTRETIVRDNGVQVVTIRDRHGDVIHRSRIMPDGREYVLVYAEEDDRDRRGQWRDPGLDLPPMRRDIQRRDYILESEYVDGPDDYYEFLQRPPVERVERLYSVDEVKRSARVRDIARRVDLDTLTFEFGAASISESEIPRLEGVAQAMERLLERNPAETFLIEGHTDAVGSDVANLALSDRRAEAVADALSNVFGIPPENLVTQGYGERYLKVSTEAPERENRRVAIRRITPLVAPVASAN